MTLSIRDVFSGRTPSLPIAYEADFRTYDFYGVRPFPAPVSVSGAVSNLSGVVSLDLTLRATAETLCASCGKPVSLPMEVPVHRLIVTALPEDGDEEDELLLCPGGVLDLDETVNEAITLSMDVRPLCRPDCKGVCFACGADLNRGPCRCAPRVHPELAKLQELL